MIAFIKRKLYIVFFAVFLLAGCFSREIYKPNASEGKLLETWYHANSGYGQWDEIEFDREGVHIAVQVVVGNIMSLAFSIPEGMKVELPIPVVTIQSSDVKDVLKLQADQYYWYEASSGDRQTRRIEEPMIGQRHQDKWSRWHRSSIVIFKIPQSITSDFAAIFPTILVNGKEVTIPNIHFHREKIILPYTL